MLLARFTRVILPEQEQDNVFWWTKWVEDGRFELNIGGIEAEWVCGPSPEVVEAKTALRDRFAVRAAPPGPPRTPGASYLPSLGLPIGQVNIVGGCGL